MQRVFCRPYLLGVPEREVDPLPQTPVSERQYGLWLRDLVRTFGEAEVGSWMRDPPPGWNFQAWCARADARAAGSA